MENLIFSLNATIPIFLLMVIGYVLRRLHLIDDVFASKLNKFNYTVSLPILLIKDISESDFSSVWDTKYVLYCFLVTLVCVTVIWVITAKVYKKQDQVGEFVQASYRGSAAVLGVAFIQNIYGNAGMAPLMIIGTVPLYNIAAVLILSFTGPNAKGFDRNSFKKSLIGIATNPIILGILIGMLVSASHIPFPPIITKTVGSMASLATPLALLSLGAGFEGKKALAEIKPTLICSFIKLLLQPAVFLPLAVSMGFRTEKLVAILVMLGAPTTVSCYIMAKNMNHRGVLTSSVIVTTTFLSSITFTMWLFILKSMGLI